MTSTVASAKSSSGSGSQSGSSLQPAANQRKLPARLRRLRSLEDFEEAARRHLPRPVFGYMVEAAERKRSLRGNLESFDDYGFLPRVLIDVSKRSQATTLFGHEYAAPFGLSPLGISALSAYRGDLAMARAAARANVPMIMSGSSLIR